MRNPSRGGLHNFCVLLKPDDAGVTRYHSDKSLCGSAINPT